RLCVISDYPATSRLNDWSELGPSDRAQVSLPISPTACLI
ncbi:MAG: hypothetical protein QOK36_1347, partial [Gaiellales bacterium]|nr:hypothetical protein [Gaiellales bacterium]